MKMNITTTSNDTLNNEITTGAFELSDAELATVQGGCEGDGACGHIHGGYYGCGGALINVGVVVNVGLLGFVEDDCCH